MRRPVPVHYTIADYEQWEGEWELMDGIPVAMSPAPVLRHQRLVMLLMMELETALEECESCRAYPEAEWRIGEDTVLRPDGVVICYRPGDYLDRPPVLVLEVLSPSTRVLDEEYKYHRYEEERVRYYLLADPEEPAIRAWELGEDRQYRPLALEREACFDLGGCRVTVDLDRVFARLG